MARLLVQLKLRLLLNALRSSTAARTSFILSTFFAFVVAVGGFYVLALFRGLSASVDLTTVIFTAFALGWLILPIFAFGLDGTLDPATLALYPLRTRPLAVGLLAASAAGAWPAANLIGLLGVTVGLASGALGLLVAVVAVVLQVLFCITLARLVTTSMARLLRSRRGKDLAVFLFIPIFALIELLGQVIPRAAADGGITAASFAGVDAWLRWLPPGLAAHAIQDASHGRPGTALARLGLLAAVDHRARLAVGTLAEPRPGHRRHLHRVIAAARHGAAAGPVRPARRRGRPVLDLPAPRSHLAGLLGHDRDHHGRRIGQHDLWPAPASRRGDRQRRRRRRVRRVLPRQLGRPHRPAVRHRGARADQPPLLAGLLLRPEHRARRDRGARCSPRSASAWRPGSGIRRRQCRPPRWPWPASARPSA